MIPDPHYVDGSVVVHHGDSLDVLRTMPDASVDSGVCDPPYGLEFMGKDWDAPWQEPGINADAGFSADGLNDGHQRLPRPSFTGTTNPRCFNCGGNARGRRDGTALRKVCTCNAPAFPNVRAVEMRAFQQWSEQWARECLRVLKPGGYLLAFGGTRTVHRLTCGIEDAGFEIRDGIDWLYGSGFPKSLNVGAGRGTALKPAREPIVVARKPLTNTVAANLLAHGTGAINIDACRIPAGQDYADKCASVVGLSSNRNGDAYGEWTGTRADSTHAAGRWPTNVLLSHAGNAIDGDLCANGCVDGCPVAELDSQSGVSSSKTSLRGERHGAIYGGGKGPTGENGSRGHDDTGGASRFFPVFRYEAKADSAERPRVDGVAHPTVKPLDLMRWLVRLVTPPGGTVLDPFAGSGTTAEACLLEGFGCVTIEREAAYLPLIVQRLSKPLQPSLFAGMDLEGAA